MRDFIPNDGGDGMGWECDERDEVDSCCTEMSLLLSDLAWSPIPVEDIDLDDDHDRQRPEDLEASGCSAESSPGASDAMAQQATVEIVEQPAATAPFRSLGCVGWIFGEHSTPENKTYPTIRINNYQGNITVAVYCANKDQPFSPHPHKLVDSDGSLCRVITVTAAISAAANECQLRQLGIKRGNRRDIQNEVLQRQMTRRQPDRTLRPAVSTLLQDLTNKIAVKTPTYNTAATNNTARNDTASDNITKNNTASNNIARSKTNVELSIPANSLCLQQKIVLDTPKYPAMVTWNLLSQLEQPKLHKTKYLKTLDRKQYMVSYSVDLADDCDSPDPESINMNAVRLVFQVFLHKNGQGKDIPWVPLTPVISDVIFDDNSLPHRRDVMSPYDLFNS